MFFTVTNFLNFQRTVLNLYKDSPNHNPVKKKLQFSFNVNLFLNVENKIWYWSYSKKVSPNASNLWT